jgi:phosphodiesterase/alkaline phosphatase D-like protein
MLSRSFLLLALLVSVAFSYGQTPSPFASGVWSGNVTPSSASVVVRLMTPAQRVRLQVSVNPSLTPAVFSSVVTTAASAGNTVTLTVQGLKPETEYFYGVEVGGVLRTETISRGRFRTFPLGRGSFKIAFSACGDFRKADHRAYDAIVAERPLLFIHMGDLHYMDTNSTNVEDYRANYDSVLNQPNQAALFRNMPIAYMWDDHDFCGNDSDGTAVGRDAARTVFRERTPHYPIASAGGTMAQAFTLGRARVIMTDLRSGSSPAAQRESASKSRMGSGQKAWFKQELISARDAGFPLVLWVSSHPWIMPAQLGNDGWGGFATERTEIANFIRDNRITNVVMLAGDMHALAFDDGTHSDYATGGGAPITVLQAAALTHTGAAKGGPFTGGPFLEGQQYGILEVFDTGGPSVACRFTGKRVGEGDKLSYIFSSSAAGGASTAMSNISMLARVGGGDDALTSGFVISGQNPRQVLVRAVGPSLSAFGLADALERPVLSVFQSNRLLVENGGWGLDADTITQLTATFDRAGAFRFSEESSRDAAVVLTLQPGPYTMQVKSADGKAGAALLEVYDVP